MRIGELAARTGLTDKTIRYYEEVGVLSPARRSASGYREFDEDAVDRLSFVRSAQAVGLTLGEIREIVALRERGEVPCSHVAELIARRAADIDRKMAELKAMRSELRRLARRAETLDPRDCSDGDVCHLIPT